MGFSRCFYDISIEDFYGISEGMPWEFYGILVRFPLDSYRISMVFLWCFYDTGFFKKNSHPPTCCHITPDPPAPP